jgi:hypothetical protein
MDKFPSLHIYCFFIQWPTYSNVTQLCVVLHDEIFSLGDTLLGDGYMYVQASDKLLLFLLLLALYNAEAFCKCSVNYLPVIKKRHWNGAVCP